MAKQTLKKTIYLTKEAIEYLEQYKVEKSCRTIGNAIEEMIKENQNRNTNQLISQAIAELTAEQVKKELNKTLDIIRVRTGYTDKSLKVMLEMMNALFVKNGIQNGTLTDVMKVPIMERAEEKVEKEIEAYRLKKLEREAKKNGIKVDE